MSPYRTEKVDGTVDIRECDSRDELGDKGFSGTSGTSNFHYTGKCIYKYIIVHDIHFIYM